MRSSNILSQVKQVLVRAASGNPTGIAGLFQHPNPRPALIQLYNHTLEVLEHSFPPHSIYKQSVKALTNSRLKIVQEEEITENIENKIGAGLIEELLIQANEELNLANELSALKVWEELEEKPSDDQWVYFGKKI